MTVAQPLHLDFVSDIVCPWCAIGLNGLERALQAIGDAVPVTISFQPFELNPSMGAAGEDIVEHLAAKYGITPEQIAQNQAAIRERGAAVGFAFGRRERIWNTFAAHRLLWWAGVEGSPAEQRALKHALLQAYHGEGRNVGTRDVLIECASSVGLDPAHAAQILDQDLYGVEVREAERRWQQAGVHAVPAVIVDGRWLISGGQPPEVYERALREIAAGRGG